MKPAFAVKPKKPAGGIIGGGGVVDRGRGRGRGGGGQVVTSRDAGAGDGVRDVAGRGRSKIAVPLLNRGNCSLQVIFSIYVLFFGIQINLLVIRIP
jgi:hypothetical protein